MVGCDRRRVLRTAGAALGTVLAGCSTRNAPTQSLGRRGRYEVLERTDPVRAEGAPVTDCSGLPVECAAGAAEIVRAAVAQRTGCAGRVPVRYFERGLLVLAVHVVDPPYDAIDIDSGLADRLREAAPRSVPAPGSDAERTGPSTATAGEAADDSLAVYARTVLREGAENGVTPDWSESC